MVRGMPRHAWVAAMRISPDLGVHRLCMTPMSSEASARASSVWGTCRFISSPSKSALYGLHTHSLKRNVLHQSSLGIRVVSEGWCLSLAGTLSRCTAVPEKACRPSPVWVCQTSPPSCKPY